MADNWTKNTIGEKNLLLSFVTFGLALHISCSMGLCVFDYKNISEKMCFHYSSSEVEIIHMYKVRIK
jgi:hypothetical protein